jgi:hypothetical protein
VVEVEVVQEEVLAQEIQEVQVEEEELAQRVEQVTHHQ